MPPLLKSLLYLIGLLLLACALAAYRQHHTQTIHYAFLYWNLFLALIPLGLSLPLLLKPESRYWRYLAWPLLALWLLFFPNAPYLVSDLMHIYLPSPMPRWYDPLMLVSAAFSGLYCGFLSLWIVEQFLARRWPVWAVKLTSIGVWCLTGLGIYLGRIPRWNSWDLLNRPQALFYDIVQIFRHPQQHPEALALMGLYSCFLILNYGFWKNLNGPTRSPQAKPPDSGLD